MVAASAAVAVSPTTRPEKRRRFIYCSREAEIGRKLPANARNHKPPATVRFAPARPAGRSSRACYREEWMPPLKQIARKDAYEGAQRVYTLLFGDRDPVAEPGTATGTP